MGVTLIAALVLALWADQRVQGMAAPEWLRWMLPGGAVWPAGTVMLLLGLLVVPLAAREMGAMFRSHGIAASRRWMAIAGIAGLLASAFAVPPHVDAGHGAALVATVGTAVLVGSLVWHIRKKDLRGATAAVGAAMFAFVYLGLMFGFLLALRREHSAWVVAGVVVVTKSCDIGAYFTGKTIGRHKLIPWLSPGKTWEGLVGGVVTAALVAMGALALYRHWLDETGLGTMGIGYAAIVGGLFAITGQAGDLLESVLKRDAGMKDSGQTLPGFGGVLDVLDSVLLVAPVAFWLLTRWRE